jgi:endogenous inhibitor of DNA gyrase (YacG/DUF329 family)
MVDLGRWFRGQYSIDRDLDAADAPPGAQAEDGGRE